jgi:hypothetical protein
MFGFVAAFWSFIRLLVVGVLTVVGEEMHWPTAAGVPLLTIAGLLAAMWAGHYSFRKAEEFGNRSARESQMKCRANEVCPATISNWDDGRGYCEAVTQAGFFTRFHLCYRRSEDRKSFELIVRRNIDSDVRWVGGVRTDLTRHEE